MRQGQNDLRLWQRLLAVLRREWAQLEPPERTWIAPRLAAVAGLQAQLHALFVQAGGEEVCAACRGGCCEHGVYHLTLVNLLGCWAAGRPEPEPEFDGTCPFLGAAGCALEPAARPFNCVTFVCERIDERFTVAERERFAALERELRLLYEAFDRRFTGSSLRGLLLRAESLGEGPYLARREGGPAGPTFATGKG